MTKYCWRGSRGLNVCEQGVMASAIDIPDIRQRDEHDCGDAVLRAVCEYHAVRRPPRLAIPIDGTSPDALEAELWRSGLCVIAGVMDVDDLRYHTRRSRPVICCITTAGGVGHWVIVSGVLRGRVHYHCPIDGPQTMTIEQYQAVWSDTTRRGVIYPQWGIATYRP